MPDAPTQDRPSSFVATPGEGESAKQPAAKKTTRKNDRRKKAACRKGTVKRAARRATVRKPAAARRGSKKLSATRPEPVPAPTPAAPETAAATLPGAASGSTQPGPAEIDPIAAARLCLIERGVRRPEDGFAGRAVFGIDRHAA